MGRGRGGEKNRSRGTGEEGEGERNEEGREWMRKERIGERVEQWNEGGRRTG